MPTYERLLFDRFEFRGLNGCQCFCSLEIMAAKESKRVVIATELEDNPGTSVTNVAEHLASFVCERFAIDPKALVWIEHYAYPPPGGRNSERTFDLVTFSRREPDGVIKWGPSVLRTKPDGWPGYFSEPQWHPMKNEDWCSLGLAPRSPAII